MVFRGCVVALSFGDFNHCGNGPFLRGLCCVGDGIGVCSESFELSIGEEFVNFNRDVSGCLSIFENCLDFLSCNGVGVNR